jgi:hypothetical protein
MYFCVECVLIWGKTTPVRRILNILHKLKTKLVMPRKGPVYYLESSIDVLDA